MKELILIGNTNTFESFKYKTKLLGNTVVPPSPDQANLILKNATILVLLRYVSNFSRSPEISLINWIEVELKFRWIKYCVLSVLGNENDDANVDSNNIIFTIKDTKLCFPVVTLSEKDNQNLSKLLSKGFERLMYWN